MYLGHNALLPWLLPPHHGVGFPSPGLPIGKDAHVVAFKGVEQHLFSNVLIYLLLRCKLGVLSLGGREQRKTAGALHDFVLSAQAPGALPPSLMIAQRSCVLPHPQSKSSLRVLSYLVLVLIITQDSASLILVSATT